MKSIEITGTIVLFTYWFHLLRNISPAYYGALGIFFTLFLLLTIKSQFTWQVDFLFLSIVGIWCYATLSTLAIGASYGDTSIGLIRFWSSIPLAMVGLILATRPISIRIRWFVLFYCLAALTIPLQFILGPITWFAESSERAGTDRFAALTGSLTSFGTMVGIATLGAICYFKAPLSIILIVVLMIGSVLSLQKAAFVNILLAFGLSIWITKGNYKKNFQHTILSIVFLISTGVLLYLLLPSNSYLTDLFYFGKNIIESFTSGDISINSDVTVFESMADRLTYLPNEALDFWKFPALILGAGVFGGAGALGYPHIPMAHNGVVELILIFGYPIGLGLNFYLLYVLLGWKEQQQSGSQGNSHEIRFLFSALLLFCINNLFSGGGFFQPVSASVFWLVLFRLRFLKKLKRSPDQRPIF